MVEHQLPKLRVAGSNPVSRLRRQSPFVTQFSQPLGVIGNTSDSGSEESWFDPRRGNSNAASAAFCCGKPTMLER